MKKALLIAFHWPPFSGSSGVQRTLKFTKYLREFGWEPIILSASPKAYPSCSDDLLPEIPAGVIVRRAFALDAGRQLAIRGRYLGVTALPDRWVSWWPAGVIEGLRLIRRHRPDVIWATYPIATAHLIAATLSRMTGVPLVADYRDAMVVADFPEDPRVRRMFSRIERRVIRAAGAAVFTTPRSRELYRLRYPEVPADKLVCIRNGYDEADFRIIPPAELRPASRRLTLLHSGLLKLNERDPRPFLGAVADLLRAGTVRAGDVDVVFRAPGDEAGHRQIIREFGLEDVVRVEAAVGYEVALREMTRADALLLFQDAHCNHLVPAKLYEYIRAQRPVLALTDSEGETADLMREAQAGVFVNIASREDIRAALPGFLQQVREGSAARAPLELVRQYARREQTGQLAALFERVAASRS